MAAIAEQGWQRAGVRERIELMVGDARLSLDELLGREDGPGCFDLVFIDADKEGYALYLEAALALLRPGGTVMVDDSLWSGRVVDGGETDPETEAIRALNARLAPSSSLRGLARPPRARWHPPSASCPHHLQRLSAPQRAPRRAARIPRGWVRGWTPPRSQAMLVRGSSGHPVLRRRSPGRWWWQSRGYLARALANLQGRWQG